MPGLRDEDFRRLLEFRSGLRRFLRWSEEQAAAVGVTPAQHQLMLAIRGHDDPRGPTVRDIADHLLLKHHSAVELADRAVAARLIKRRRDDGDHRVVRLQLAPAGARCLDQLSSAHVEELSRLVPRMRSLWADLELA